VAPLFRDPPKQPRKISAGVSVAKGTRIRAFSETTIFRTPVREQRYTYAGG